MSEQLKNTGRRGANESTRRNVKRIAAFLAFALLASSFLFAAAGCESTKNHRDDATVGGFLGAEKPSY